VSRLILFISGSTEEVVTYIFEKEVAHSAVKGKWAYIITAKRMISGDALKYWNGLLILKR
jgi:hypothetical protein